jgi:CheY-like chemotaxis protein
MDGLDATRAIRAGTAGHQNCEIPIIAMTAFATSEDREACFEAGMTGYITKPINLQDFMAQIQSALND